MVGLRSAANNMARFLCLLRCITDPPIGSMPVWLPNMPDSVGTAANTTAPCGGEWFFPATGEAQCNSGCCSTFPGDPQSLPLLGSPERVILYFHGGAFCLCTSKTHRDLLMRLVDHTSATVLCIDYRRPPEHPWPAPVDDCLAAYVHLLQRGVLTPEGGGSAAAKIVFAGDSAGGGMCLAVMAAARASGWVLPQGAMMLSPWVDLTDCNSGSWTENQQYGT